MRLYIAFSVAVLASTLGGCYYFGPYGDDEFERYLQRKDGVTLTAGDAAAVNAATQMNHPWPYGVSDRRIFIEGSRAVRAVARYRAGTNTLTVTGAGSTPPPPATGSTSSPTAGTPTSATSNY